MPARNPFAMRVTWFAAWVASGILLSTAARAADSLSLPQGPNRNLIYGQCRTCHDLQYLKESAGIPRSAWNDILDSMKQYGLSLSPDARGKILDYLATYLGPNPPKSVAKPSEEVAEASKPAADGAALFKEQCSACHQKDGKGVAGQFPPLAGNPDLFLSHTYPMEVVLNGMEGKIVMGGETVNGAMPSFNYLSDQNIATIVNYVRSAWGNHVHAPAASKLLGPEDAAKLRKSPVTPAKMHMLREQLKKK